MWNTEKDKTGGAAFPFGIKETSENYEGRVSVTEHIEEGLTIRDYFAAKVMQSMCDIQQGANPVIAAEWAYAWADAMLEARKK